MLLTDLYQKISTSDARRKALNEFTKNKKVIWKWFDDRQAKWQSYTDINQTTIDDAFNKGDQIVRLTASRRKYTIYLSKMVQSNDETGNRRPIMRYFEGKSEPLLLDWLDLSRSLGTTPTDTNPNEENKSSAIPQV